MARGTKSPNTPHHRVNIPCEDMPDTPWLGKKSAKATIPCYVREVSQSPDLAGLLREQKHTAKHATSK